VNIALLDINIGQYLKIAAALLVACQYGDLITMFCQINSQLCADEAGTAEKGYVINTWPDVILCYRRYCR